MPAFLLARNITVENHEKSLEALNAHFKLRQEISERIRNIFLPLLKQQDALQNFLNPMIGMKETLKRTMEPFLAEQERWKKLGESILFDISSLTKQATDFIRSIQRQIPAFEQLQRSFHELPPRIQEALLLLGSHGWYMDEEWTLPDLFQLIKGLSSGNIYEAEHTIIEHFESRIDEIEESIIKRFPHREKPIMAAFNAHRKQEYELSIPVFLAQTDGICKEITKEYLFRKKNKKPCTAIYVEQIVSDTLMAAILSPLAQALPIGASEHERPEGFNELNRHMVMHGESLNYGNKTNSLKAISLINYVAHELTPEKKLLKQ